MFKKSLVLFSIFSSIIFMSCGKTLNTPVITAEAGNGSITISWEDVPGAQAYNVVYQEGSVLTVDATVSTNPITSPFELKNLNNGSEYTVAIKALGSDSESELSLPATAIPVALVVVAPGQPIEVSNAVAGEIDIAWSAVADVDGYYVYCGLGTLTSSSDPGVSKSSKLVDVTSYKKTGVTEGTTYTFFVRSYVEKNSLISESSDSLPLTITKTFSVPAPDLIIDNVSNTEVTFSWITVNGADLYNLYYQPDVDGTDIQLTGVNSKIEGVVSPYTVTNLTKGTKYRFSISSVDRANIEVLSENQVTATPNIPSPANLVLTNSNQTSVSLSWDATTTAGESYVVYHQEGSSVEKTLGTQTVVIAGTTTANISGLTTGVEYTFAVSAKKDTDESALSNSITHTVILSAPSILTVAGDQSVTVRFSSLGAEAGTEYRLYYETGEVATITSAFKDSKASSGVTLDEIVVNSLSNDQIYTFGMTAYFAGNESAMSNLSTATPEAPTVPSIPTIINTTPENNKIEVSFSPVTGADSYKLYYETGEVSSISSAFKDSKTPSGLGDYSFTVSSLTPSTTYSFAVTAVNAQGESAKSDISIETTKDVPAAPLIISTTAGDGTVRIYFGQVVDADSYKLYYQLGDLSAVTSSIAIIPKTPSGDSDYFIDVSSLTNEQIYTFQISASNTYGDSLYSTAVSETPSATAGVNAPTILTVTPGDGTIHFTFTKEGDITKDLYRIYYQEGTGVLDSGTLTPFEKNPTSESDYFFDLTGLTNGLIYSFAIATVVDGIESPLSLKKEATPNAVISSPVIMGSAENQKVEIRFLPVTDAVSYKLYYKSGELTAQELDYKSGVNPVDKDITLLGVTRAYKVFDVTGLTNGQSYSFAVKAVGATSNESVFSNVVTETPTTAPNLISAISFGSGKITMLWEADVSALLGYKIYYKKGTTVTTSDTKISIADATTATYTIEGLDLGEEYTVAIAFSYGLIFQSELSEKKTVTVSSFSFP